MITTLASSAFAVPTIPAEFAVSWTPAAKTGANKIPISITIKVVIIPMTSPVYNICLLLYKGIYL